LGKWRFERALKEKKWRRNLGFRLVAALLEREEEEYGRLPLLRGFT
jgi:hypothetical protein